MGRCATAVKGPRIPQERRLEIAVRVPHEGLRAVASDLGVSHEMVRGVVRRIEQVEP